MLVHHDKCCFLWQPDPLIEALESVVGDGNSFNGNLEATQAESEVPAIIL